MVDKELLDIILGKNTEKFRKNMEKEARTDNFKSDINDVFTNKEIGYTDIVDDLYEEIKGRTLNKKESMFWKHDVINKYSLGISPTDFRALATCSVYMDMLMEGIIKYQKAGETLIVIRMLHDSISNGKKSTDYSYPDSLETAMGGDDSESNKKLCFCAEYSVKVPNDDGTTTKIKRHFFCVSQDQINPGQIGNMSDVFITEDVETLDENDIKRACYHTKRQNLNEYDETRNNYCALHNVLIKLKPRNECSMPILDYISLLKNTFFDEIVENYFESSDILLEMDSRYSRMDKSQLKTKLIEDFEIYGGRIYSKLTKKCDNHIEDLSYIG